MNRSDIIDVEYIPGTVFVKKAICKLCGEKVFEVPNDSTLAQVAIEAKGLAAHLEFRHNLMITFMKCSDPSCLKSH